MNIDSEGTITKLNSMEARRRDTEFDIVIGHIEDLLIDESFQDLQQTFLENYWHHFDDGEENKLCYMNIFLEYTNSIDEHITSYLQKYLANFSMEALIIELRKRQHELDGEVFEMLYSLTDFEAFKQMFLDYRKVKTYGELDLSSAMKITSVSIERNLKIDI